MAEYLPPVVTRLEGEIGDFLAMVAEAKAALGSLAESEDKVQHAMDVKSAAAEIQAGRLGDLSHALAITAGANQLMAQAEEELGYRTTVTSVTVNRQAEALAELGGRLALTAGNTLALMGVENNLAGAMDEKTLAAVAQVSELSRVGDEMTSTAAKAVGLRAAEAGLATGARTAAGGFAFFGLTLGSWLTILHLFLVTFAAQIVADTIGIVAFGVAATRAIGPAVQAVDNLTTAYAALDPYQKAAALSLKSFEDGLHQADEAGIFGVFYQGLNLIKGALSSGSGIVTQATQAFSDFFGMLAADAKSSSWAELLGGKTNIIRTDLDALFQEINAGINLIPVLFHNFNFLGLGVIHLITGFLNLTRAVLGFNPLLTKTAALATAAWGAYKIFWVGLGAGPGILQRATTGLIAFGSRVAVASTYMSQGIGVAASYAFGLSEFGIAAAGAAIGVAAVIGGLILLAKSEPDTFRAQIAAFRQLDNATGNNAAGYFKLASQLKTYNSQLVSSTKWTKDSAIGIEMNQTALNSMRASLIATGNTINQNATNLGNTLGLTRGQVISYANATGVDLTHALQISGTQFVIDQSKIRGYAIAVRTSHNPLAQFKVDAQQASNSANSLQEQVTALAAAYNALVTPTLNVIQGQITLKDDEISAATAIHKANDEINNQSAAGRAAGLALIQAANDTISLSNNIKQQTGSTQKAIAPLQNFASWLEHTGAKGSYVNQVLRLIKEAEDALYNKTVIIDVKYLNNGQPGGTPPGTPGGGHVRGPGSGSTAVVAGAAGSNAPAVTEVHVYMDSREIFRGIQKRAVRRQKRTGNNGLQRFTR